MYFVGLDLAWGVRNQSGVAVLDDDGRLVQVGAAVSDDEIATALAPYVEGPCVVGIDAPLIVNNPSGYRLGETLYNRDFAAFEATAQPANSRNPLFDPPRAEVLCERLGLNPDPHSRADRRAIEVYPHAATISLFELGRTLKYKRRTKDVAKRRDELLRMVDLIEGLADAVPRLGVRGSPAWLELRKRIEASDRPFQLNACEDPVDAVLCAYVALYFQRRREDVTIYGDGEVGYIVTPALPPGLTPRAVNPATAPTESDR
ncbi:GTP pyrophosphokinase [Mycobacterium sp. GA-1285]|nr:GTP pyrophosphokinase [Mycobacterium sp. GA-1285]